MSDMNGLLLSLLACALAWGTLAWLAPDLAGWIFIGGMIALAGIGLLPRRIRKP